MVERATKQAQSLESETRNPKQVWVQRCSLGEGRDWGEEQRGIDVAGHGARVGKLDLQKGRVRASGGGSCSCSCSWPCSWLEFMHGTADLDRPWNGL